VVESGAVKERILQMIADSAGDPAAAERAFDDLAVELFVRQYERIEPYRRLCQARGVQPAAVTRLQDIPLAPSDIFKHELIRTGPVRFSSSGTTGGYEHRSHHVLGDPDTYHAASMTHFRRMVLADEPGAMDVVLLGPSRATHPNSSLGWMYSWCSEVAGCEDAPSFFDADGHLDGDAAVDHLRQLAGGTRPVLILAVSSAWTAVLERLRQRRLELHLPADSRVVDTGGAKGGRTMSANGLRKAAWRFLHIPAYQCVNEYGMTELLSQFYDDALRSRVDGHLGPRAKVGPAWVRTRVLDPADLEEVADGEPGLLAHVDLANWESLSFLLTMDVGRKVGAGFEVLGRAAAAEPRGCSQLLSVESQEVAIDAAIPELSP
jgi:hypothetical protein